MSETGDRFASVLAAAGAGEPWAFDALVRSVDRQLVGFCRARGAVDPEGTANEVLVRMCQGVDDFRGNEAQFRAWVFTIARNRLVDERRHHGRRVDERPEAPDELPEVVGGEGIFDDLDQHERVSALLAGLTDEQREVVVLRIVVGLSVEETATVVGRRPGAVRALQHRALAQLRQQMHRET